MHCHEYAFWLRKYDLDGFSARVREIKRERPPSEERKTRVDTRPLPFRAAPKEVERSKTIEKPSPFFSFAALLELLVRQQPRSKNFISKYQLGRSPSLVVLEPGELPGRCEVQVGLSLLDLSRDCACQLLDQFASLFRNLH